MIVEDIENPTGMFSKAGRLSIEMFALLQEKDKFMQTDNKKSQLPKFNEKKLKERAKLNEEFNHYKKQQLIANDPFKSKSAQILPKSHQPFTKVVSRAQLDSIEDKVRINNQKFGLYYPKYHFIYEKSPFYQEQDYIDEQREKYKKKNPEKHSPTKVKNKTVANVMIKFFKNQQRGIHEQDQNDKSIINKSILHKSNQSESQISLLNSKVKGVLNFSTMPSRKPINEGDGPHERRFEFLNFPDIYSRVQKIQNIYFQKAENNSDVFKVAQSGLQYSPNMDSIYPKSPKMIPNFKKMVARKFPQKPIYTLDESYAEVSLYRNETMLNNSNVNKSQIIKKIPTVNFDKMVPRNKDQKNQLISQQNTQILTTEIQQEQ